MHITLYIKYSACLSDNIKKNGFKSYGKQNYKCKEYKRQFIGDHALTYQGCHSQKDSKIRNLMVRSSGIKDIACVEKISKGKKLENHFKAFDLAFFYINHGYV